MNYNNGEAKNYLVKPKKGKSLAKYNEIYKKDPIDASKWLMW
jgi:hypothetical protein|tara:strand:+ start:66 stop:191 length:126 start_codon:yes stop_codon:yes gene_type:complete